MPSSCHLSLLLLLVNLTSVYGSRIIGGEEVNPYTIKYQASLQFMNYHFCGGTLIHPEWVLSAAHCWRPQHMIKVVLSEHNLQRNEGHEQVFSVSAVIRHYQYQHWSFDNDIMLLKLDRPAILNDKVQVALFPERDAPPLASLTPCTVSGWGVTSLYSYSVSPVLRSVNVDFFPNCWVTQEDLLFVMADLRALYPGASAAPTLTTLVSTPRSETTSDGSTGSSTKPNKTLN
ncbi:Trypsin-1 [Collichthys lucidus]|uniref:trypsin n=1 Tax=Collichthys lucidus TaxID=240159 RepID=A0A4U5UAA0_COLLU|nr:Trypsin-1 [Collichthys lucidus]